MSFCVYKTVASSPVSVPFDCPSNPEGSGRSTGSVGGKVVDKKYGWFNV